MSLPSLSPQPSAPFSLPSHLSFRDTQLHYYIPLPSPYFILFALLPLYLIYISPPIPILARTSLLFSLSLPSFSISSFVCYSWVFSQSLSPSALQYGVPDVLVSRRWILAASRKQGTSPTCNYIYRGFVLMTSHNVQRRHLSNFRYRASYDFLTFHGKFPTHVYCQLSRLGKGAAFQRRAGSSQSAILSVVFVPPKPGEPRCYVLHLLRNTNNRVTFKGCCDVKYENRFFLL